MTTKKKPAVAQKPKPKFDVELALEGINLKLDRIIAELDKLRNSTPKR